MLYSQKIKFGLLGKLTLLLVFAYSICLLIFYFLYRATGNNTFDPKGMIPIIAINILLIFIFWRIGSPPKEKFRKSFSDIEESFKKQGDDLILDAFGKNIFEKLYLDEQNWIPIEGIDEYKKLLSQGFGNTNTVLNVHLHYRLANNYYKDSQYGKAYSHIKSSLVLDPDNLFLNLMAGKFAGDIGDMKLAVGHFKTVLGHEKEFTPQLREFVIEEIEKIESGEVKKREPPSGKKWMIG